MNCTHGLPKGCCAICALKRKLREYEAMAKLTGRSIAELDADLTAPDTREERDDG